jgi:hypothetical protein
MNEQWDDRLFKFLTRTGEEIKAETQRLVAEVKDPETQRKVKEGLREFGSWVKQTAEEAADMIGSAVKKAEAAFSPGGEKGPDPSEVAERKSTEAQAPAPPAATRSSSSHRKTVGKSKRTGAKKTRPTASSKTIGRKK